MFKTCAGASAGAMQQRQFFEDSLLQAGLARKEIPLNGGSDSRRAIRDVWMQRCLLSGVPFDGRAFQILIGGRMHRGRGSWFIMQSSPGRTTLRWVHWRRAKRLARRGDASVCEGLFLKSALMV